MKTTNKKLQLKKETMAVLNDKSLFGVIGGGNPNEEDGDSSIPTRGHCTNNCTDQYICILATQYTEWNCPVSDNCTSHILCK